MSDNVWKCTQCNRPEASCDCPRYCTLCQNPDTVRLCNDGLWYCMDCREACDYKTQDEVSH